MRTFFKRLVRAVNNLMPIVKLLAPILKKSHPIIASLVLGFEIIDRTGVLAYIA